MKLRIKPLWTFIAALVLLTYSACRKTDQTTEQQNEPPETSLIEERFFNSNRSSDRIEKTLVDFIKRKNEKEHFVEQTVKQIGYPIWNKIQIVKYPGMGGRGATDTTTYAYIPFSIPAEEIVNASMVIRITSGDTTTNWLCDWQYQELPHGSPATYGTAEQSALFFMQFQHLVFGDSIFVITDSALFSTANIPTGGNGRRELKIKGSNVGGRGNSVWDCVDIYYCGTPDAYECTGPGGCDYDTGCPTGECYLYYSDCTCILNCPGGGEDPPPGSGGSSGGGGGGGSSTPPECQPEASKGTNVNPNCEPGWNPTGGGTNPPYPLANQSLIDSLQGYPCAQSILTILPNLNNTTKTILQNSFGVSENFNVIFRADTTMPNYENGATSRVIKNTATNTYDIGIRLNSNMLKNSSKEFILNVMFHESIHAFMNYQWFLYNTTQIDSNTFKAQFPQIWSYKNGSNSQHIQISETYVSNLKQTVLDFNNIADTSMARAISWVGLQSTPAWVNLGNDTLVIRQKASIAKYGTLAQMTSYHIIKCN